jgi:hypothetical protein
MTIRLFQTSRQIKVICGECRSELYFLPSVPILSNNDGYYLITSNGGQIKLQVVDMKDEDNPSPIKNENIPDMISLQCSKCGMFSSFSIAIATIRRYVDGQQQVILIDRNGVSELPIVLFHRISDGGLLPRCVMDKVVE